MLDLTFLTHILDRTCNFLNGHVIKTKFRGDHHLVTKWCQGLPHKYFIDEWVIDFSGIKEGEAAFNGFSD